MPCIYSNTIKKLAEELPVLYILMEDFNGQHIPWSSTSINGLSMSLWKVHQGNGSYPAIDLIKLNCKYNQMYWKTENTIVQHLLWICMNNLISIDYK